MITTQRNYRLPRAVCFGLLCFLPVCLAQKKSDDKISEVTTVNGVTTVVIELQNAPNNMEPVAEPRRIQVDDRANVKLLLKKLSPLDVCTLNGRTPAPTAETNVAESLVASIAKLAPFAVAPGLAGAGLPMKLDEYADTAGEVGTILNKTPETCKITSDAEYKKTGAVALEFSSESAKFVGSPKVVTCGNAPYDRLNKPSGYPSIDQTQLACQLDLATRQFANYAAADYRGTRWKEFDRDSDFLKLVRSWYTSPIPSVVDAGKLQAMVDEMAVWAADLHKKYDYQVPAGDSNSPSVAAVPPVNGRPVLLATPLNLTFAYPADRPDPPDPQTVQVSSGGAPATFRVTSSSTNWLTVTAPCLSAPPCTTPVIGSSNLLVRVDPRLLGGRTVDTGTMTISGTGQADGSSVIVNVTVKQVSPPTKCDLDHLREVDEIVDRAKAAMTLLTYNNTALQGAQASLKTSSVILDKVWDDFVRRKDPTNKTVYVDGDVLVQEFNLGTDRKATITGNLSCVTDVDGKTATTDAINFSILYQEVPHWTASAGLLTSFQRKRIIGLVDEPGIPAANPPTFVPYFAVTDSARAQVLPMAFVNYRITPHNFRYDNSMSHYGKNREDALIWTGHISAGIGANTNNGATQPEFFLGLAVGLNRFMIHPGVHFGRMQSLGGGYTLNTQAPSGISVPINWSYHPAFSIGFSVRLAPY